MKVDYLLIYMSILYIYDIFPGDWNDTLNNRNVKCTINLNPLKSSFNDEFMNLTANDELI